jgi:cobalamin synthase
MPDTTTVSTTGTGAAAVAEKAVEAVMRVEPMIAGGIGMFVPGAAPILVLVQPWIVLAAPFLERALNDVTAGNNGDVLSAFFELIQHISKGQPNSPILTPDESTVGSG